MTFDRRSILGASIGMGAGAIAATARAAEKTRFPQINVGLDTDSDRDQTAVLQAAIDAAAEKDAPVVLPPGKFIVGDLRLRSGSKLFGTAASTTLIFGGGPAFVTADKAEDVVLEGIAFDATYKPLDAARGDGALTFTRCKNIRVSNSEIHNSAAIGLSLIACSGRVSGVSIGNVLDAGLKSLDAQDLDITGSTIAECGNNGILVWRSSPGEDGTTVSGNRISQIRNAAGGSGEYGNGINVFRAGSVLVTSNRISDCAYTAIRGNAASNIQIIANSCERLGEVALYSEFAFEGALIASNLVDTAATGISVTNFREGGRLAVIQGNLVRNLFRREKEEDKRGEGIGVEADAVVIGNTIENAPTVGIQIGWGPFMRDVSATGNVIRHARVGISVTDAPEAGTCLIANNLISNAKDGAIRQMQFGAMTGPDLVKDQAASMRIQLAGNIAV